MPGYRQTRRPEKALGAGCARQGVLLVSTPLPTLCSSVGPGGCEGPSVRWEEQGWGSAWEAPGSDLLHHSQPSSEPGTQPP